MASKLIKQEIECLSRLFVIGPYLDEMVDFFLLEGIMKKEELPYLKGSSDKAKYIQVVIAKAREANSLILSDFEWQVLPYEKIRIYLVTSRVAKEFLYSNA